VLGVPDEHPMLQTERANVAKGMLRISMRRLRIIRSSSASG
jgi:hypothetical protein